MKRMAYTMQSLCIWRHSLGCPSSLSMVTFFAKRDNQWYLMEPASYIMAVFQRRRVFGCLQPWMQTKSSLIADFIRVSFSLIIVLHFGWLGSWIKKRERIRVSWGWNLAGPVTYTDETKWNSHWQPRVSSGDPLLQRPISSASPTPPFMIVD
jgi:hypothetical protein